MHIVFKGVNIITTQGMSKVTIQSKRFIIQSPEITKISNNTLQISIHTVQIRHEQSPKDSRNKSESKFKKKKAVTANR